MIQTDNRQRFIELCQCIKRDGIEDLMKWLDDSDFYSAPASTKYHGSYHGGLAEHSLNVYEQFKRLAAAYPEIKVTPETAAICTLFHDLCKVNFYVTERRNRKDSAGQWESYDTYSIREKFCYGGHGSKSVFLIQNFIKLTPEEAVAINCHMGAFENENVGSSYEQYPLAWLLHVADEAATYITESKSV